MSYEAFVFLALGIALTIWSLWGGYLWRKCSLCNPSIEPNPIEIEARRLAEIEIEELCRLIEGNLEPIEDIKQRPLRSVSYSEPVPIMPSGVTWVPEYFCLGCNQRHNDVADHIHVYNMDGSLAYSFLENGKGYA